MHAKAATAAKTTKKENGEEAKQFNPTYFWLQYTKDIINVKMLAITCKTNANWMGQVKNKRKASIEFDKTILEMF